MQQPRSRWQQIRRWMIIVISVGVPLILVGVACYEVIRFGWGWTGFAAGGDGLVTKTTTEHGISTAKQSLPGKTLWDWMQLLLVPVMLIIGGAWLNHMQKKREESATTERDKLTHAIATDNQQQAALQSYIDKIGELLLREQEHLGASPGNPQVENIARARTATALQILDPARRMSLLRFLRQAGVLPLCTESSLLRIDLHDTDLIRFDLSNFNLSGAKLSGADLKEAKLIKADLSGAKLIKAKLIKADLRETDLRGAKLSGADLREADLRWADLRWADLSGAKLIKADLSGAKLSGAKLSRAKLRWADLREADLREADLRGADLRWAKLSGAKLIKADLSGADLSWAKLREADLRVAKLSGARFHKTDLRRAKGLTDKERADYQSRGALVDPTPSTALAKSTLSSPTSSPPQSGAQGISSTSVQSTAGTPLSASDTAPSLQKEGDTNAKKSEDSPALSASSSENDGGQTQSSPPLQVIEDSPSLGDAASLPRQESEGDTDGNVPPQPKSTS